MMVARRMRHRRRRRRRRTVMLLGGGLLAVGIWKMSKSDKEKIEQQAGKPAEELTDEQLEQIMDQLDIEKQELSDQDWEYVDQQDAKAAAQAGPQEDDSLEQIARLAELHEKGIITDDEFNAKKKQLLGL